MTDTQESTEKEKNKPKRPRGRPGKMATFPLMMASQTTKQRGDNTMKKDYTKTMNYAVVSMIDRSTQDDHRSKIQIAGLFENPIVAEDSFMPYLPSKEVKRYLLRVEDLERFEEFYNFIQDLNEKHGEKAIFHLSDGNFTTDEENLFRQILNIWTNTRIA